MGRKSAGQNKSRHIDIRYFWIRDRLLSNNIKVEHCPTEQMLADFFYETFCKEIFFVDFAKLLWGEHI